MNQHVCGFKNYSRNLFNVERFVSQPLYNILIIFVLQINYILQLIASEAKCTVVPSKCIYGIRRQRIKSLKMLVESSDKNQFSDFYCLESISKMTQPDHGALRWLVSGKVLKKFCHNFDSCLKIVLLKLGIDIFDSLDTMPFSAS